ncbi:Uncharacterised protein [Sphingomonas paucimobilis]|nr:Uncharacterised protein [Sphingomonas paucimobilis]
MSTTSGAARSTCAASGPAGSITTRSIKPASRSPSEMIAARVLLVSMMAIRMTA